MEAEKVLLQLEMRMEMEKRDLLKLEMGIINSINLWLHLLKVE